MSQSSMDNLKVFEERIKRIEAANRKSGRVTRTSSGEYFRKEEERRKQRRKGNKANWTFRILLVMAALFGVKTYIMVDMGQAAYDARMAELAAGDQYEKIAAMALAPDPVTSKIQELLENAGVMVKKPKVQLPQAEPVAGSETTEASATPVEPASSTAVTEATAN